MLFRTRQFIDCLLRFAAVGLLVVGILMPGRASAIEIAVGSQQLNSPSLGVDAWETVSLDQSYTAPLVFPMPVDSVPSESSIRVTNVSGSSFDIAHVFPDNSSSGFTRPDIDYLVIEDGEHDLGGTTIVAGSVTTQEFQSKFDAGNSGWETIDYSSAGFTSEPVILAQIQTNNNETAADVLTSPSRPWMTVAMRNVTTTSAEISLDRAETTIGSITQDEVIGYLVIEAGVTDSFTDFNSNSIDFQSVRSNDNITDACVNVSLSLPASTPLGFAAQNTRDGGDGGWLRKCSISNTNFALKVQEDIATDTDVAHTTERAGVLAFTRDFRGTNADIGFRMEADTATFPVGSPATLSATVVNFPGTFVSTPRVFLLPTNDVPEPASLRILNISTTSFTVAQVQPQGESGAAPSMNIDYLAAVDGVHYLDDDNVVEVGVISTSDTQFQSPATGNGLYTTIEFDHDGFAASPVTMLQIQTTNSGAIDPSNPVVPWMTVAAEQVNSDELDVALERAEVNDGGTVFSEDIAYFAIDANIQGTFIPGSPLDPTGFQFETLRPTNIEGVDNGCDTANFLNTYSTTPIVIASQSSRNGNNGGWAKRCSVGTTSVGLQIDEDRSNDSERGHIAEDVDVLVWSGAFSGFFARPSLDIVISPDQTNPDPGDTVVFTVTVTNNGNSRAENSLVTTNLGFFTGLILDAYAGTPFEYTDAGSGLTLGAPEYSQDNGVDSFGYSPPPTGVDPTITDWRIPFTGNMPSNTSFTLRYQTQVN